MLGRPLVSYGGNGDRSPEAGHLVVTILPDFQGHFNALLGTLLRTLRHFYYLTQEPCHELACTSLQTFHLVNLASQELKPRMESSKLLNHHRAASYSTGSYTEGTYWTF